MDTLKTLNSAGHNTLQRPLADDHDQYIVVTGRGIILSPVMLPCTSQSYRRPVLHVVALPPTPQQNEETDVYSFALHVAALLNADLAARKQEGASC